MKRLLTLLGLLAVPSTALAVSINDYGWNCAGFLHCGDGSDAVQTITTNITIGIVSTISALAVIAVLYGAIRMATSQGGEGKEAGKKAIIWASTGMVLAILTGGIILYVTQLIFAISTS
ncbi:MAG TPA: hypothetical protein PKV72_00400 [Candidatus Peribacteria bacterium]|nr:hypothetical protein [Candidatus Peribacteria bacterium]